MSSFLSSDDGSAHQHESELRNALTKYWGFEEFLPLQLEAMNAVMNDRDSLCVFPTGGGKSLCFQAPAICKDGLGVVVSPLISLMKDQVDSLRACGVNAACLNSTLSGEERRIVKEQIQSGLQTLIYIAPEMLLKDSTLAFLNSTKLSFIAIDEAHCVSEWGHDFRPEYRKLGILKDRYPNIAIHAYTATATEQVRKDIAQQLALSSPEILVASVDRPNLTYKIRRRQRGIDQIVEVLNNHRGESGIIYCISRKDVESTSNTLNTLGFATLPYHAGLDSNTRKHNQDRFLRDEVDIIVATIAFGMGIDKSNVRYVIHASMPKSLEGYQQESGRAGRDGLDAECWMFFNTGDFMTWKRLVERSESQQSKDGAIRSLEAISRFCNDVECRHVALAAYFGEQLESKTCDACDVCLDQIELVDEPLVLAQKIVSCVYRVDQGFGGDYVSKVLSGSREKRILDNGHDQLSTFGLLNSNNQNDIRKWLEQLISQGFLARAGEYNVIKITDKGNQLLKGNAAPKLTKAVAIQKATSSSKDISWEGVDRGLFERLREVRKGEAADRDVPAFVVFSDASLRDMARRRPSTSMEFQAVHGVGDQKLIEYGETFVAAIIEYCSENGGSPDISISSSSKRLNKSSKSQKRGTSKAHLAYQYYPMVNLADLIKMLISDIENILASRWPNSSEINAVLDYLMECCRVIYRRQPNAVTIDQIDKLMSFKNGQEYVIQANKPRSNKLMETVKFLECIRQSESEFVGDLIKSRLAAVHQQMTDVENAGKYSTECERIKAEQLAEQQYQTSLAMAKIEESHRRSPPRW